ncbi:MAG TPA: beta galactosidase jelly roll domain-containing protein [Pseudonocardiaceae bacterium]|nr:beta galactosidase jelly roll domain-containing protein [Pseudonocardiaceae bacterium]
MGTSVSMATTADGHTADVASHKALGLSTLGTGGWQVLTSATATQGGAAISAPGFDTRSWLPVKPDDAGAPGTEVEALLRNGACPNVFFSDNMKKCFGQMTEVGPETIPQFMAPWWYRTTFTERLTSAQTASLVVNGVVGKADVWVNGKEVATSDTVTGAYTKFAFDVTGLLRHGANALAIEVYPNDPNGMYTIDDVDWNQIPPDNNTGIQFPVQLLVTVPGNTTSTVTFTPTTDPVLTTRRSGGPTNWAANRCQRRAAGGTRWRLRAEHLPGLLGGGHRAAVRPAAQPRSEHDPDRGSLHAGRLLRAGRQGRSADRLRLPVP